MVVRSLALGLTVALAACSLSQQSIVKELATRLAKVSKSSDPKLVEKDVTGLLLEAGFTVWKTDRSVVARPAKAHGIAFTEVEIKSISETLRRGVKTKFSNIGATLDLLGDQVGTAAPISPKVKSWLSAPAGTKSKGALDEVASVVQALSSGRGLKHWPFANPKSEVDALQGAIIMRVVTEELLSQLHDPDLLAKSRMNTLFASREPAIFEETKTYSAGYKPGLLGDLVKIWESVPGNDVALKAGKMEFGAAQAGMIMLIGSDFLNSCAPNMVLMKERLPGSADIVRTRNQIPGGKAEVKCKFSVDPKTFELWAEGHRDLLESIGAKVVAPSTSLLKGLKTRWFVEKSHDKPVITPLPLFRGGVEVVSDSEGVSKLTLIGASQTSDLSREPLYPVNRFYGVNVLVENSSANQIAFTKGCLAANGVSFSNAEAYSCLARFLDRAKWRVPNSFNELGIHVLDWDKATVRASLNVSIQGEGSETMMDGSQESFTYVLDEIKFALNSGFIRVEKSYVNVDSAVLSQGASISDLNLVSDLSFLRSVSTTGRSLEQTPGNGRNFESSGWFNFFGTDDRDAEDASKSVLKAPRFALELSQSEGQWTAKVRYSIEITGNHHSSYKYDWSSINDFDRNSQETLSFPKSSGELKIIMKRREGLNGEEIFEGSLEIPYELEGLKKKTLGKVNYFLTIHDYSKVTK